MAGRTKKTNNGKRRAVIRQQRKVADQVKHFWCADGTMLPKMLSGSRDKTVITSAGTVAKVLKSTHPWQVMVFVFCRSVSGDVEELYHKVDYMEANGTIKSLSPKIRKMCDSLIDSQKSSHFVSYAWWATSAGDVDLAAMEDELVAMFDGYGAFNPDLVNVNMATRFG